MPSLRRFIVAAGLAAAIALSPAHADVKSGVDAWQAGDYAKAVATWRPLAERGDPDAQFNMGQAYKLGRGVPPDLKLAQTWYEKAAQQGHEEGQANLGLILYQNGQLEAAIPWIRKASDNGDPRAQYVMGAVLFNGDFVTQDFPRSYALMTRAAAQGLSPAAIALKEMDGRLSPADREKGLELAREIERRDMARAARQLPGAPRMTSPPPRVASNPPPRAQTPRQAAPPKAIAAPIAAPKPPGTAPTPVAASLASAGGRWRVQLGAYGSAEGARDQWAVLTKRIGALASLRPSYEAVGALTRLRVGPLADRSAADRLCAAAKSSGQACIPIAP